jgi:hypothetical protein
VLPPGEKTESQGSIMSKPNYEKTKLCQAKLSQGSIMSKLNYDNLNSIQRNYVYVNYHSYIYVQLNYEG